VPTVAAQCHLAPDLYLIVEMSMLKLAEGLRTDVRAGSTNAKQLEINFDTQLSLYFPG
jgi:hypothetical protein